MDGNIKDTPPIIVVPRREDRPRWDALRSEIAAVRRQARRPQAGGRGRSSTQWLADVQARAIAGVRPARRAATCTRRSNEGDGKTLHVDRRRQAARDRRSTTARLGRRARRQARRSRCKPAPARRARRRRRLRDATSRSPSAPGSSSAAATRPAPIVARMDNGNDYRGWDLWLEGRPGRHAHRQQVARRRPQGRRQDAAASRTSGRTSRVTYDGSGKAAGVKVYVNGEPQPVDVAADTLQGHDPHRRCRSRSASGTPSERLADMTAAGPAALRPRPVAARGRRSSPGSTQLERRRSPSRPTSGPPPRRRSSSTGGWRRSTRRSQELDAQARSAASRKRRRSRPAARSPT